MNLGDDSFKNKKDKYLGCSGSQGRPHRGTVCFTAITWSTCMETDMREQTPVKTDAREHRHFQIDTHEDRHKQDTHKDRYPWDGQTHRQSLLETDTHEQGHPWRRTPTRQTHGDKHPRRRTPPETDTHAVTGCDTAETDKCGDRHPSSLVPSSSLTFILKRTQMSCFDH